MKEKIDWYQEVLELEPGSKVFFPLARLLAEGGEIDRSIQTLQHGLDRHPEFIEARLYLVELLFQHGRLEQCRPQLEQLEPLFSRYAGFWQAWGSSASSTDKVGDSGLMLSFLAATFRNKGLSLADIFNRGLESILGAPVQGAVEASAKAAVEAAPESVAPREQEETADALSSMLATHTNRQPLPAGPKVTLDTAHVTAEDAEPSASLAEEESEEGEERFSLRTRSMAEVLAEQGDYAGALEIYQELSAAASTPEEAADLQHRISTLTVHLGETQETAIETPLMPSPSKHRVLSVLEALAERLESRVHG